MFTTLTRARNVVLWALLGVSWLPAVASAALVKVVEYVGDDAFLTANPAEIAALDNGHVPGCTRTGIELWVHDAPAPGRVPVCRFYSDRFAPRSVHFSTAFADECDAVGANPDWVGEGIAFYARMPDSVDIEFSPTIHVDAFHDFRGSPRPTGRTELDSALQAGSRPPAIAFSHVPADTLSSREPNANDVC